MFAIPLIRTDDASTMTPIERTTVGCEQVITALMMQATLNNPTITEPEIETFTTLSAAAVIPAEA